MNKKKISIVLSLCILLTLWGQGERLVFAEVDIEGSEILEINLSEIDRIGDVGSTFKLLTSAGNPDDKLEYMVTAKASGAMKGEVEVKQYYGAKGVTSVEIPSEVENEGVKYKVVTIGKSAFRSYKDLESVTLLGSIRIIGHTAFAGCKSLRTINFPEGLTEIGPFAFYECNRLRNIEFPESLREIKMNAFESCYFIESITLPEGVKVVRDFVFHRCSRLESVTLPDTIELISINAFWECRKLKSINFPESLLSISGDSFRECISLESLKFPKYLRRINEDAFRGCTGLTTLEILGEPPVIYYGDAFSEGGNSAASRKLVFIDEGGQELVGRQLHELRSKYKEVEGLDKNIADNKWYGWYIGPDLTEYFDVLDGVLEADYSLDSWNIYQEILEANNVIASDTVEEIGIKLSSIKDAQGNLIYLNQAALDAAKLIASDKVEGNYTELSWTLLAAALALPEDTNEEIGIKASAVSDAIEQLVYIEISNPVPRPDPTPDPEPRPDPEADLREVSQARIQVEILAKEADTPTKARTSITSNVTEGTAKLQVSENIVKEAIKKAQEQVKKSGQERDGISVEIVVDTKNKKANNLLVDISKSTIGELIKAGVIDLSINSQLAKISLDFETLKTIQNEINGDIDFSVKKLDNKEFSQEAKEIVENRPIFNFSITASKGQKLSEFGKGKISISLPYILAEGEKEENISIYYISEKGNIQEMPNSFYDKNTESVKFMTDHFSKFAIGYKEEQVIDENTIEFTDIKNHWAKESIELVTSRGLFTGTGQEKFSPDMSMTRGMFVTVLARLANADVSSYKASNFTDVKTDHYYMEYIEWASKTRIVEGINQDNFGPDIPITREQIAVILYRYANYKNYDTSQGGMAVREFEDYESISDYALRSIGWTVNTGLLHGDDNKLMPKDNATRAEVAAIMMRFIQMIE